MPSNRNTSSMKAQQDFKQLYQVTCVFCNNITWNLFNQVWCGVGRLDVPFRRRDLCTGEAADLLHQLGEVPVGGEHQPHEEAGLCQHTEENDHHQVQAALTLGENEVGVVLWVVYKSVLFSLNCGPSSEGQSTRVSQTSPSWRATGSGSWWSWRERSTLRSP